jgi:hypothetical protein
MAPKKKRSPREKKRLSLDRDRRNNSGENDKASRKDLPLKRAKKLRKVRHATRSVLRSKDPESADAGVRTIRRPPPVKVPDVPLRQIIEQKRAMRARLADRKARRGG